MLAPSFHSKASSLNAASAPPAQDHSSEHPDRKVYWLVSQGSRLNVSTGSLLFKPIRISLSHDKNRVLREYDWASGILKTSLGAPHKDLLSCWPKHALEAIICSLNISAWPSTLWSFWRNGFSRLSSSHLIASPQRQRCYLGRWTTDMLTLMYLNTEESLICEDEHGENKIDFIIPQSKIIRWRFRNNIFPKELRPIL